jgi:transcriptional regulator with XRE-family HTH domain
MPAATGSPMTPADLTARREQLGYSQHELARRLGVNQASISRWESGRQPIPAWLPLALEALARKRKWATQIR